VNIYSVAFFRSDASAYESERAGAGRGVFFVNYLRSLVRAFWIVYGPDGWRLEIRHDDRVREFAYFKALERMQDAGLLKLIPKGPVPSLCGGMLWRMDPLWEPETKYLLCRDLDALPTFREKRAVNRWIDYGVHSIHSIHDSVSHAGCGLMGGLVGFDAPICRDKIPRPPYESLNTHGDDQRWLMSTVAPLFEGGIRQDTPDTLGPRDHALDVLGSHLGGAFHVDPLVRWVDENPSFCPRLGEIRRCES
jgi:hypothetical protein